MGAECVCDGVSLGPKFDPGAMQAQELRRPAANVSQQLRRRAAAAKPAHLPSPLQECVLTYTQMDLPILVQYRIRGAARNKA
jgi:hypothetical protein